MRAPFGECGFESRAFRFRPDGEMEITPRFYREVPGSSPGRGNGECGVRNSECGIGRSGVCHSELRIPNSAFQDGVRGVRVCMRLCESRGGGFNSPRTPFGKMTNVE